MPEQHEPPFLLLHPQRPVSLRPQLHKRAGWDISFCNRLILVLDLASAMPTIRCGTMILESLFVVLLLGFLLPQVHPIGVLHVPKQSVNGVITKLGFILLLSIILLNQLKKIEVPSTDFVGLYIMWKLFNFHAISLISFFRYLLFEKHRIFQTQVEEYHFGIHILFYMAFS